MSTGARKFHYRRSKTNKAPRKRTFIANMTKAPQALSDAIAASASSGALIAAYTALDGFLGPDDFRFFRRGCRPRGGKRVFDGTQPWVLVQLARQRRRPVDLKSQKRFLCFRHLPLTLIHSPA